MHNYPSDISREAFEIIQGDLSMAGAREEGKPGTIRVGLPLSFLKQTLCVPPRKNILGAILVCLKARRGFLRNRPRLCFRFVSR
jgi:hypothetical protein